MKTKNIITIVLFLFLGVNSQAQFWKKIKDRAKDAAEETVLNKTSEKAAEKTDKTMEKIFDMDFGKGMSTIDPSVLPESYTYTWRYTLQMEHKKGSMAIDYFLRENGTDYGSKLMMQQKNVTTGMLMIMDPARGTTTILMDMGGQKTGQVIASPQEKLEELVQEDVPTDYDFKEIGTKEILGYTCQGFQMENEEAIITMYVASNTPVSLNQVYGNDSKRLPKGFDPKWLDRIGENSLMMEMDFKNKKKPKQSSKMRCIALEESPLEIVISAYQFPQLPDSQQE